MPSLAARGSFSVRLALLCCLLGGAAGGCGHSYDASLPNSTELGAPRGYREARIITHFHSPYSYDACDRNGFPNGSIDLECLHHLKNAACLNRVDFVFVTDHPNNMANYEMKDLVLAESGDTVLGGATPFGAQLANCSGGFVPTILPGFEGKLLALGMTKHLETDPTVRNDLYGQETAALAGRLVTEANAIVAIPHTEGKTIAEIRAVGPGAIEIYNFHANIDPKIRLSNLHVAPFEVVPGLLTYILDPYHSLNPDYGFISFVQTFPTYFQTWDELIKDGTAMTGLGGTDSHENVFPQKVEDGERLDSHRRIMRFLSNHYLVSTMDAEGAKDALRKGRGWMVFEGFGTPVGMDFFAQLGTTTVGVGESAILPGSGTNALYVTIPHLHSASPHGDKAPIIRVRLRRVDANAVETLVGESEGSDLYFPVTLTGAYRAEIFIVPQHLRPFLGDFDDQAEREFPWIITNHIQLK